MSERMLVRLEDLPWVKVGNPKTSDCEALRTSLLPGLLKTLGSNKHIPLPIRLFEVKLKGCFSCHIVNEEEKILNFPNYFFLRENCQAILKWKRISRYSQSYKTIKLD